MVILVLQHHFRPVWPLETDYFSFKIRNVALKCPYIITTIVLHASKIKKLYFLRIYIAALPLFPVFEMVP